MSPGPDVLERAIAAVESEIATVLKNPSRDVLHEGRRVSIAEGVFQYRFENVPPALRYVESVRHERGGTVLELVIADEDGSALLFDAPEDLGESVPDLSIEWENDFVLQRLLARLREIETLDNDDDGLTGELVDFFLKKGWEETREIPLPAGIDGLNERQNEAVAKALEQKISFIWGPPGTGKTATLGYVVQGLLSAGRRVLFLSNTNRAVDVGMQSILAALARAGRPHLIQKTTRFGELALQTPELQAIHFEALMKQKAAARAQTEDAPALNERAELGRFRCVGTTLARICTSDLFNTLPFDAVVVDEASMVNLPYVLAAASRARTNLVFAGDPMQLPPISQTETEADRAFLETDVYLHASGAKTPGDLFAWHDRFPAVTTFFDTQYRMSDRLADVISSVFYEGRLKSAATQATAGREARIWLFDTSALQPVLETEAEGTGFRPLNRLHTAQVVSLAQRLAFGAGFRPEEIGIITPFRHAARTYWKELRKFGLDGVETGTVHTFQGREKQVILFDTVMTGEMTANGRKRHYTVRPFDEQKNGLSVPRLLNVALSRCRDRLIVVADMDHVRAAYRGRFLARLLDALAAAGQVITRLPE